MTDTILSLGGVPFRGFEVPQEILFGGAQTLAVHQLIGGGRAVDALGPAAAEIVFAGTFSGTDAVLRVQTLDAARALGAPLPLIWGDFYYSVIIAEFSAVFTKEWWIPFEIRCVVIVDPAELIADVLTPATQLIANDVASAGVLAAQAGLDLSGLDTASPEAFTALQGEISARIGWAGAVLGASGESLAVAPDTSSAITALTAIGAGAGQLAALASTSGLIGRAAQTLATTV